MKNSILILLLTTLTTFAGIPYYGGASDVALKGYTTGNNWLTNGDIVSFTWAGRLPTIDSNVLTVVTISGGVTNTLFQTQIFTSMRWRLTVTATADSNTNLITFVDFENADTNYAAAAQQYLVATNVLPCSLLVLHAANTNSILTWDGFASPTYYEPPAAIGSLMDFDANLITSDGGGNVTANTFNPVSDRARKEQIEAFKSSTALAMVNALTNYTWRFKSRTNWVANLGTHRVSPASGMEIGPMAQDWQRVTGLGTGTNISLTAMNGLLLGAVQELSRRVKELEDREIRTNHPKTHTAAPLH